MRTVIYEYKLLKANFVTLGSNGGCEAAKEEQRYLITRCHRESLPQPSSFYNILVDFKVYQSENEGLH